MAYEQERQVAIAAVTRAAKLCERVRQQQWGQAIEKQDRSPVTLADFGAQAIICQAIGDAFPADPIVGEESAALLRQPQMSDPLQQVTQYVQECLPEATTETVLNWIDRGTGAVASRYWTLDPIDGTKGFVRGDQYAIALALIEQGEVQLGVMGCPALSMEADQSPGVLFVAVRGQGAELIHLQTGQTQPLKVDQTPEGLARRLAESVEIDHGNPVLQRSIAQAVGLSAPPLAMDSQAKYGIVAAGQAALYIRLSWSEIPHYRENIWDHAAGAIVVEEAGGTVTDVAGKRLDFACGRKLIHNQGIVASNGALHAAVLSAVQASCHPV